MLAIAIRRSFAPVCVLSVLMSGATAHAGMSYLTASAPGGFMQAGAGSVTSGGVFPGTDLFLVFPPPTSDLMEQAFVGDSSANADASYVGQGAVNSASGTAGLGYMQASAENNAPNSSWFADGMANGGWSETFTVSAPGLTGQTGFMQFTLDADGSLYAAGFAGAADFHVVGYKDDAALAANQFFSPGGSDPIGTSWQYGHWSIVTAFFNEVDSKNVSDTVTFAVPITFGTPFKLGIYARAAAGMRSSSNAFGNSQATVDFSQGLRWGGVTNVYLGTTPIANYTIVSGSGTDWTQPVEVPASADLNGDGVVNAADLAILLGAWGTPAGDVDGDGTTNAADLAVLLGSWS